jgi:3-hydroxy acid dehydrogenase / malonic semialdehyde reductase
MKTILITGASSGIGKATALLCAKEGHSLLICARREKEPKELTLEIQNKYKTDVHAFNLDVSKKEEVFKKIEGLPKKWNQIKGISSTLILFPEEKPIQEVLFIVP